MNTIIVWILNVAVMMILATSGQRSYNIRTSIPEISGHGFL